MNVAFKRIAGVVLGLGLAMGCSGSMSNVKNKAQGGACEVSCDEAYDSCMEKCAGTDEETGETNDNAACELACDEARKKCVSECKEK